MPHTTMVNINWTKRIYGQVGYLAVVGELVEVVQRGAEFGEEAGPWAAPSWGFGHEPWLWTNERRERVTMTHPSWPTRRRRTLPSRHFPHHSPETTNSKWRAGHQNPSHWGPQRWGQRRIGCSAFWAEVPRRSGGRGCQWSRAGCPPSFLSSQQQSERSGWLRGTRL